MTIGVKRSVVLIVAAIASAAYWLGALALLEGATSFDYSTGGEPDDNVLMVKAGGVIALALLAFAAILFLSSQRRGMRNAVAAIASSVLAGAYWSSVAFFLLGVTAGDARDGVVVDRGFQRFVLIATLLIAPALFALALGGWQRLNGRRLAGGQSDA